jgi:hypothetical protein
MAGVTPEPPQLRDLNERAARSVKLLTPEDGPVVVEFAGSPKSGKSTTIDILAHFFKRSGFKVWAPTEGASKRTPYHLRRDLVAFNTWTLNYAISELLVAYHNVDRPNLVILDRGPFDSLAWIALLRGRGELAEAEYNTIREFALHPRWSRLIARVYLFTCDAETSMRREGESKLTLREGTAMNRSVLDSLLDEYRLLHQELGAYPLMAIDTSDRGGTTPLSTSFVIASDVLSIFEGSPNA